MDPSHVLAPHQVDLVELLLNGYLIPVEDFTADLPLMVSPTTPVLPGERLHLHDPEGVPVGYVDVHSPPPKVTGRLTAQAGVGHADALDLRLTPQEYRAATGQRPTVGARLDSPLSTLQVAALAKAAVDRQADLVLLCPLGAHDVGDAAWYAAAAAARAGAELVREALSSTTLGVRLVAVPPPPQPGLWEQVLRAYRAEPVILDPRIGQTAPAVAAQLARFTQARQDRGVVLFFTGLSGSGKSTIAKAVAARIMESGKRLVTLLDGDLVRRHLSSELTFSPEHRDLNVRRIGWVAAEVARHGGLAVACPIAPYDDARRAARQMAEQAGAVFLLVHVATPLEVCEQRDRKGLYALARAGTIPSFTGLSAPYEVPEDPDVRLDTSLAPLRECVEQVLSVMRAIPPPGVT